MTKKNYREKVKLLRQELSLELVVYKSRIIMQKLQSTEHYKKADCIYTYVSFGQEVNTTELIHTALSDGKRVAVPKIKEKIMNFYYISDITELKTGFYGILEPETENPANETDALLVMPGLAFDRTGNRIGYGGGYYDKYLAKQNTHWKAALAFELQIFEQLPCSLLDKKPDMIISEEEIYDKFN